MSTTLTLQPADFDSTWLHSVIALLQSCTRPIEDEENEGYFDGTSEIYEDDDEDEDDVAVLDEEEDL
ncbi:MAG: hypothetical protein QF561_05510 [Phycisphaerales bacterium]|jgi:hypothetical protein|nr:hypothetical protein [Phycisphaerales bacterium]